MTQPLLRAASAARRVPALPLAAFALLPLVPLAPATLAAAPASAPVITDFHRLYEISPADAAKPHRVRWDLDVLFYDREWNVLWVEGDGFATFVAPDPDLPDLAAGQRLRVEGELVPAAPLQLGRIGATVQPGPARVRPLDTTGHLADAARFNNRLVTVDAVVDAQTAPDPHHLILRATAEGLPLVVRVPVPRGAARPALAGQPVRITGVYTGTADPADAPARIALWAQGPDAIATLDTPGPAASPIPAAPAGEFTLPGIHAFYDVAPSVADKPHRVGWELDVLYFDREWDLLWVGSNGFATFVAPGGSCPRLAAGDRIHVSGTLVPARGLSLDGLGIARLDAPSRTAPLATAGHLGDFTRFTDHLVTVEAVVDRQRDSDPTHLMLEASAEGLRLVVRVQVPAGSERPRLAGKNIRATGVYVAHRDFAGDIASITLWAQGTEAIEVLGSLDEDPLFATPVVRIEQIANTAGGPPIHIVGTVHALDNTAATITLRDSTGQVVVSSAQTQGIKPGADLEAVGHPMLTGIQRRLLAAKVRPLRPGMRQELADHDAERPRPLRLADQVLGLEPAKADRGRPVQLFGVATWMAADRTTMFVEDASGAVEIRLPALEKAPPNLPCAVLIEGRTARGSFAPLVAADSVVWSNPLGSPEPHRATLDELLVGDLHGRWVAVQAYVRGIARDRQGIRLDLTTATGELVAQLPADARLTTEAGAIVTIHGVCCAIANERHQLAGVRLVVPSGENIETDELAPMDPYAIPTRSLAALREFGPTESSLRRVCTIGTVVLHEPGRFLCLQDGNDSLLVLSRDRSPLQPGDRVEAVGIPGREGSRLVLREGTYRRTAHVDEPEPLALAGPEIRGEGCDGRLVRLAGTIVDTHRKPAEVILSIEADKKLFSATLPPPTFDAALHRIGSVVALRGVYRTVFDEYRQPVGFGLALRLPGDITVLADPPLWNTRRALIAASTLLFLTGIVVSWVAVLRARVAQQTRLIRAQLEQQKRLETELLQAQRVESLTLLAGGIAHDFNNLLTGILVNLSLARMDTDPAGAAGGTLADAELATLRARDLTQQLLIFSKGGAPTRSVVDLAAVVRESANFALHGSPVRAEFDLPADLWLADADRVQAAQVVQNLAINAVQAMPRGGRLHLALANEELGERAKADLKAGRYLRLTLTDTGSGIPAAQLDKIFDPYFTTKKSGNGLGLATVFTIVRRHGGHVEVESEVGRGTTFRLWLPASDATEATAPSLQFASTRSAATPPAAAGARILVMDDDPLIRRSAALALLQAGHEPTITGDGHEALAVFRCAREQNRPFSLLLLDLTIPGGMGGADTLDAIRRLDPTIKAIASSGHVNDPVFLARREHGFDDLLPKPYQAGQLQAVVAAALGTTPTA